MWIKLSAWKMLVKAQTPKRRVQAVLANITERGGYFSIKVIAAKF